MSGIPMAHTQKPSNCCGGWVARIMEVKLQSILKSVTQSEKKWDKTMTISEGKTRVIKHVTNCRWPG